MIAGIESYAPSNNRSQAVKMGSNDVILDAYNANPSSMSAAIQNFVKLNASNKVMILGDMFEMGEESMREHLAMIELVHQLKFEHVIFVGKDFYACKKYEFQFFETTEEAKDYLSQNKPTSSMILVKGSRGMKLELLTSELNG
jgi:UDP-N-acetylmuramoyl-tripeptide--D-alanyl-D-alanine ligase